MPREASPSATRTCSSARSPSSRWARPPCSSIFGQHQKWWRYFRLPDLWPLVRAVCRRRRADGPRLRDRPALPRRPPALGRGLRLPAAHGHDRRRPPAAPHARRAARREPPSSASAQGAGRRRGLGRPDGRARDAAQPQPRQPGDRVRRRRPPQAGDAQPRPRGARDDRRDRRDLDRTKPDEVIIAIPSAPGTLRAKVVARLPRARRPRADAAHRLRAAARRRPAHPPASRGPGRGRPRPRPGGDGARPRGRLPRRTGSCWSPAPAARSAPSSRGRSPGSTRGS